MQTLIIWLTVGIRATRPSKPCCRASGRQQASRQLPHAQRAGRRRLPCRPWPRPRGDRRQTYRPRRSPQLRHRPSQSRWSAALDAAPTGPGMHLRSRQNLGRCRKRLPDRRRLWPVLPKGSGSASRTWRQALSQRTMPHRRLQAQACRRHRRLRYYSHQQGRGGSSKVPTMRLELSLTELQTGFRRRSRPRLIRQVTGLATSNKWKCPWRASKQRHLPSVHPPQLPALRRWRQGNS